MYEYTPGQVKMAVTGYGKAEKRQVMDMTKRLLKLTKVPRPDDAADALALALCHARSFTSRLPQIKAGKGNRIRRIAYVLLSWMVQWRRFFRGWP